MASPREAIARGREGLRLARIGLNDIAGPDPHRRRAGLADAVVYGVSITNRLHTMRHEVGDEAYNAWWLPRQADLKADPLIRYFWELRSTILKEGVTESRGEIEIDYLDTSDLNDILSDPPPGAIRFQVGGSDAGIGWVVEGPDGTEIMQHVEVPPEVRARGVMRLPNAPTQHRGQLLDADMTAAALCGLYLDWMEDLISEAAARFL